jgi:hypothetical protein
LPSVFQSIFADAASCGTVDELADERCTTSSCGCVGDEADWDSPFDEEPFDENPEPSPPPTFRGVRRF